MMAKCESSAYINNNQAHALKLMYDNRESKSLTNVCVLSVCLSVWKVWNSYKEASHEIIKTILILRGQKLTEKMFENFKNSNLTPHKIITKKYCFPKK